MSAVAWVIRHPHNPNRYTVITDYGDEPVTVTAADARDALCFALGIDPTDMAVSLSCEDVDMHIPTGAAHETWTVSA